MPLTLIHTADWQLGKTFGRFDAELAAVLRKARLDAIDRLASLARSEGAQHILVAGDVFDSETLPAETVRRAVARIAAHADLTWHFISGNHDPARPGGVWDTVREARPPNHVRLHLTPGASEITRGVHLLAAPLSARAMQTDPTAWMDAASTPAHAIRIGLAHGSVKGFDSLGEAAVPIDPARWRTAGLAYFALGDWHGTKEISARVWYAGTPEPDRFGDNGAGQALVVRIDDGGDLTVSPRPTAEHVWIERRIALSRPADLEPLAGELRALADRASRSLWHIVLSGRLSLTAIAEVETALTQLAPVAMDMAVDRDGVEAVADDADLRVLADPTLQAVADRLRHKATEGDERQRRIAGLALLRLARIAADCSASGR